MSAFELISAFREQRCKPKQGGTVQDGVAAASNSRQTAHFFDAARWRDGSAWQAWLYALIPDTLKEVCSAPLTAPAALPSASV